MIRLMKPAAAVLACCCSDRCRVPDARLDHREQPRGAKILLEVQAKYVPEGSSGRSAWKVYDAQISWT